MNVYFLFFSGGISAAAVLRRCRGLSFLHALCLYAGLFLPAVCENPSPNQPTTTPSSRHSL